MVAFPRTAATAPPADEATAASSGGALRPSTTDLALMTTAVLGASASPPLMAAMTIPPLAIVLWRTALATILIAPWTALRCRAELRRLTWRSVAGSVAAGGLLAMHFSTFVPSLSRTSVASAASLVAMQPVWTALLARVAGERVHAGVWAGLAISLAGVLGLSAADATLGSSAFVGNALALVAGMLGAAYVVAGSRLRRTVSTGVYTLLCYGSCALLMLVVCALTGTAMAGYSHDDWLKIAALTFTGQLLTHSLTNVVLARVSPTVVSLAGLLSVPLAALVAAAWLGQVPPLMAVPSALVILAGIALAIRSGGDSRNES